MSPKQAKIFLGIVGLSIISFIVAFTPKSSETNYKSDIVKNGGTISGRVVYTGEKYKPVHLSNSKDSHVCRSGYELNRLVLGNANGLSNTFVYLTDIRSGKSWSQSGQYEIDQIKCAFVPHLMVMPKGKKLTIKNSDPILHNVHAYLPNGSTTFNLAMPIKNQSISKRIRKSGLISIQCDAGHPWMYAYIFSSEHPYAVITDANGYFELNDVPDGEYSLAIWHESWQVLDQDITGRYIFGDPIEQDKKVRVRSGQISEINFEVK